MKLREQILELFSQGIPKRQIAKILGCSRTAIRYNLTDGAKEKMLKASRLANSKNKLLRLSSKITSFQQEKAIVGVGKNPLKRIESILSNKISTFCWLGKGNSIMNFSVSDFLEKVGDNPKCYLTNRSIDLSVASSYQLDHIIPRAKGGENTLENCGLACRDANVSKYDLSLEDYLQLCTEVLENFGRVVKLK